MLKFLFLFVTVTSISLSSCQKNKTLEVLKEYRY